MKALYNKSCIQIEITNRCNMCCENCSRLVGHHKKPYFMDLKSVEKALQSTKGFMGMVGCMGGEPTLHPKFKKICKLFKKYIPKERRGLWTNGYNWKKYEKIIRKTFLIKHIVYNAHDYEYKGYHQPILIAIDEIIDNKNLQKEIINKCWVQERWSASINPNGAFFCEVAAAIDMLFDIGHGWKIEKDWWKKETEDFQDQVDAYCKLCSMAIPFDDIFYKYSKEFATPNNIKRLIKVGSLKYLSKKIVPYFKKYNRIDYESNIKNWKPGKFRDFYQHEPKVRIYK